MDFGVVKLFCFGYDTTLVRSFSLLRFMISSALINELLSVLWNGFKF